MWNTSNHLSAIRTLMWILGQTTKICSQRTNQKSLIGHNWEEKATTKLQINTYQGLQYLFKHPPCMDQSYFIIPSASQSRNKFL